MSDVRPYRRGSCVHFTGIQNDCCDAGVRYDAFPPGEKPCFIERSRHEKVEGKYVKVWTPWTAPDGKQQPTCQHFRAPTPEEIEADERDTQACLDRMRVVMTVVSGWRTWTKKNRVAKQEVIDCPVCKGRLHLSQAAYNGHVWGQCETGGCVSWMQ